MTANDYSIEKYVSEYLKPLEEKGIITDLRVIPCRCRIMFRLNEPSRENSMKVIIETEADEDHITFSSPMRQQRKHSDHQNGGLFIKD